MSLCLFKCKKMFSIHILNFMISSTNTQNRFIFIFFTNKERHEWKTVDFWKIFIIFFFVISLWSKIFDGQNNKIQTARRNRTKFPRDRIFSDKTPRLKFSSSRISAKVFSISNSLVIKEKKFWRIDIHPGNACLIIFSKICCSFVRIPVKSVQTIFKVCLKTFRLDEWWRVNEGNNEPKQTCRAICNSDII